MAIAGDAHVTIDAAVTGEHTLQSAATVQAVELCGLSYAKTATKHTAAAAAATRAVHKTHLVSNVRSIIRPIS